MGKTTVKIMTVLLIIQISSGNGSSLELEPKLKETKALAENVHRHLNNHTSKTKEISELVNNAAHKLADQLQNVRRDIHVESNIHEGELKQHLNSLKEHLIKTIDALNKFNVKDATETQKNIKNAVNGVTDVLKSVNVGMKDEKSMKVMKNFANDILEGFTSVGREVLVKIEHTVKE